MNKRQENRLSMYLAVQTYMNNKQTEWEGLPILVSQKADLDTLITGIQETRRIQETDITGITRDKENKSDALGDKVVEVASSLGGYALINGDTKLQSEVYITPAHFDLLNDTGKITFSELVKQKAVEYLSELTDFNTTQEDIDELQSLLNAYSKVVQSPREAMSDASAATVKLEKLMYDVNKKLEILDKLVYTLQTANPDFVQGYKNARIIVD